MFAPAAAASLTTFSALSCIRTPNRVHRSNTCVLLSKCGRLMRRRWGIIASVYAKDEGEVAYQIASFVPGAGELGTSYSHFALPRHLDRSVALDPSRTGGTDIALSEYLQLPCAITFRISATLLETLPESPLAEHAQHAAFHHQKGAP